MFVVFAISWKLSWPSLNFLQILKTSPSEKKHPVTPKHHNGLFPKKLKENVSKNKSNNTVAPGQTDSETNVKRKAVPNGTVPKEAGTNSKVLDPSKTQQPAAPKRKRENGKANDKQTAKKKKATTVVEERKPTEYVCSTYFCRYLAREEVGFLNLSRVAGRTFGLTM